MYEKKYTDNNFDSDLRDKHECADFNGEVLRFNKQRRYVCTA